MPIYTPIHVLDWAKVAEIKDARAAAMTRANLEASQQALEGQKMMLGDLMDQMRFGLEAQKNNVEAQKEANQMQIQSKRLEMESSAHVKDMEIKDQEIAMNKQKMLAGGEMVKADMTALNGINAYTSTPEYLKVRDMNDLAKGSAVKGNLIDAWRHSDQYSDAYGSLKGYSDVSSKIASLREKKYTTPGLLDDPMAVSNA